MMSASLVTVARRLSFIRESGGANAGAWVQFLQRFCDGVVGDSWCADFVSLVENVAYYGKPVSPRTGSCQLKLDYCDKKGWVVVSPAVEDLYFYVNDAKHAHHVGIVSQLDPLIGIAGNTSADGTSSNGDGVYEHEINPAHCVFVRLPTL